MLIAVELGERRRRVRVGCGCCRHTAFRCLGLFPLDLEPVDLDDLVVCVITGVRGSEEAVQSVPRLCFAGVDVDAPPPGLGRDVIEERTARGRTLRRFDLHICIAHCARVPDVLRRSLGTSGPWRLRGKCTPVGCAFFVELERPLARRAAVDLRSYGYKTTGRSGIVTRKKTWIVVGPLLDSYIWRSASRSTLVWSGVPTLIRT